MCENKGIKKDHSADLHATANNEGNKYGGKIRPSWQNFTAKCPKREGGVFPALLIFCSNWVVTFPDPDSRTAGFGEGVAECCPWASAALSFPAEADCCRSSVHTSALSLTAESEKQMHHSC